MSKSTTSQKIGVFLYLIPKNCEIHCFNSLVQQCLNQNSWTNLQSIIELMSFNGFDEFIKGCLVADDNPVNHSKGDFALTDGKVQMLE